MIHDVSYGFSLLLVTMQYIYVLVVGKKGTNHEEHGDPD
jgi:hypothetical protein